MFTSRLQNERTDVLVRALLSLNNEEEVYRVLEDLLTIREVGELSQRLEVAFMLRDKATYSEIVEKTGVSTATIGRVNRCLNYGAAATSSSLKNFPRKKNDRPCIAQPPAAPRGGNHRGAASRARRRGAAARRACSPIAWPN